MKWFDKIFRKKTGQPLVHERQEEEPLQQLLREVEEWIPVWHGTGQWENGMWLSYTIFYSPDVHKFELITRGFRAEEHGNYHKVALPNLFRVQRTLYQFSPEQVISHIVEENMREGDEIRKKQVRNGVETMSDEEIQDRIQDSLNREDYREVARLQRELDKRRGV